MQARRFRAGIAVCGTAIGALILGACAQGSEQITGQQPVTFEQAAVPAVDGSLANDQTQMTGQFDGAGSAFGAQQQLAAADCRDVAPGTFLGDDCEQAGLANFGLICALAVSGSPRADACEVRGLAVTTPRELSPEVLAAFDQFRVAHDTLRAFELKVGAGLDPETAIAEWPSVSAETLIAKERALQQIAELDEVTDVEACTEIADNLKNHIADSVRWHRLYVKGESDRIKSFEEFAYVTDPGLDEIRQRFRNGVAELRQADQHLLDIAQSNRCPFTSTSPLLSS